MSDINVASPFIGDVIEDTPNEISDHESNDDQSDNTVHIQNEILLQDCLVVTLFRLKRFQNVFETVDVNEFYKTRHSEQTEEFEDALGGLALREENLEREDRDEVDCEPGGEVMDCYLFKTTFWNVGFWIFELAEETQDQVGPEMNFNYVIKDDVKGVRWF